MEERYLVTSALPYVNNVPHLGNLIGSTLSADVYSRFLKMRGKKVLYLCGTDCYGTTTEVKAKKENMTCKEICEKYHKIHKEIYDWFNIQFDIFGTTTTETQTEITHEIFLNLYRNGHIEAKTINQHFCETCNLFLADRYLKGECYVCKSIANGDQCETCNTLLDPLLFKKAWCNICGSQPFIKQTKHLYLKLQNFEDQLKKHLIEDRNVVLTDNAFGITKGFLNNGLESRCITRDLFWGTPVPTPDEFPELKEFKDKVFYVWFDAPIGYLSILKHGIEHDKCGNGDDWLTWMSGNIVEFMAKDNVPFHTVIFPATLLGSQTETFKVPLLTHLSSTEYLSYEDGQKFSKSNSTGLFGDDVIKLSEKHDITADYWRFYLINIRPETKDASFTWDGFTALIKGVLSNNIGNYINRCMSLSYKFFGKETPESELMFSLNNNRYFDQFNSQLIQLEKEYDKSFHNFKLRDAQNIACSLSDIGNVHLQRETPWNVCKVDIQHGYEIMAIANYIAYKLIMLLEPFMPQKSNELAKNFYVGTDGSSVYVNNKCYTLPFKAIE